MAAIDAKPCPFCGSSEIEYDNDEHGEWLQCTNCGAKVGVAWCEKTDRDDGAARLWNSRTES